MKRKTLLLLTAILALLGWNTAMAETTVTKKELPLSEAEKTWGADYLTVDGNSFTYNAGTNDDGDNWGNGAMGWTSVTDISDYTNLVLELSEATTSTVEICVANGGFWGMENNYSTTLAQGETKISIPVATMTKNGSKAADGTALDLTAVNLIFLRTGWVHEQTIKIKDFYLEKVVTDTEAKDYEEIDITSGSALEGNPTIDGTVITFPTGGKWAYDVSNINTSLYKYLVIVPKKPFIDETGCKQFLYGFTDGTNEYSNWGLSYGVWQPRHANVINLKDKKTYADRNETETMLDFSSEAIDCDALKNVYVKPEDWNSETTYDISAIYFTNELPTFDNRSNFANADYIRETTTVDTWGTICLPYAASVCGAQTYAVVGVDSKDSPTKLYLEKANGVLKAGVPYIFKTNSNKNNADNYLNGGGVFFTKAGANTVASPNDNALEGNLGSENVNVPETSYILTSDGKWGKGTGNYIAPNRAYLTLTDELVISKTNAAKYVVMDLGGGTTGISGVKAEQQSDDAIYNLNGVRISNPTKGLYIKNGKKIIIK